MILSAIGVKIGVVSDTHGLLRPELEKGLSGVDHIVHAGDIGRHGLIERLSRIAPVTAIRGNVDTGQWAEHLPPVQTVEIGSRRFYILHDLKGLRFDPAALGYDVVVSGHSHKARVAMVDGVLYLNPGSAGPRRFNLPLTFATLDLTASVLEPQIHDLGSG